MPIIVSDIAGEYESLLALVKKFPAGEDIILVGDLVDRGLGSNRVIEWAMSTPNVRAVLGNHEHMMLDFHGRTGAGQNTPLYDEGLWEMNGGGLTLASYGADDVAEEHLDWLASLPLYIEVDDCFISHSSWLESLSLEEACDVNDWYYLEKSIIWNRNEPTPRKDGKLQVFGHNSQFGFRKFYDYAKSMKPFAVCIDDSAQKKLTAYNTKTEEVYQQEYV